MNTFILGNPKIGKSKVVEKYIECNYNKPLYIGTLNRTILTESTISIHQNRRRINFWFTYEISSSYNYDLTQLKEIINSNKFDCILFDGIWNMLISYLYYHCNESEILNLICSKLIYPLLTCDSDVFMIDSIATEDGTDFLLGERELFHKQLVKLMKNKSYV